MNVLDESVIEDNGVAYINDSIGLHRLEHRSATSQAVSLHLYIPPYNKCQIFDESTGSSNEVKSTFYSKYGMRTPFTVSSN
ncbi:unnamed protein product [Oppiella nova]|uniref:Cysteine dioxygenase n=1 Tax=Oppiella nova TaxID=334625 RepID=A0A7R9MMA3_9ACAR|nr:unnamed protein product [Oppiella nova]CAG2179134.1 unnamed protein product [Oppiella nova]